MHGLRNSLNAMVFTLHDAERTLIAAPSEGQRSAVFHRVQQLKEETSRITKLLSAFDEIRKPRPLVIVEAPLEGLVADVVADVRKEAAATGRTAVPFVTEGDLGGAVARCDPFQLKGALAEVLRNALDAISPGDGTISVHMERVDGDRALIEVTDNGDGFTDFALEHGFDAFFTTRQDRLGIGLARARRIIEVHGGDIEVVNAADRGAIVSIRIPVKIPPP